MTKKKWHDWNNIHNHDSSLHRGLHAPNMVARSANDHSPDQGDHGFGKHIVDEIKKPRLRLGDGVHGHGHRHLKKGYRSEPLMGTHPTHSLRGAY
jgi:hypothetical protein